MYNNNNNMTATAIQSLVTGTLSDFGSFVIIVLTAVIGVSVAYLAFRMGYRAIQNTLMGSEGMAFNLHGESKGFNTFEEEPFKLRKGFEMYDSMHLTHDQVKANRKVHRRNVKNGMSDF